MGEGSPKEIYPALTLFSSEKYMNEFFLDIKIYMESCIVCSCSRCTPLGTVLSNSLLASTACAAGTPETGGEVVKRQPGGWGPQAGK